MRPNRVKGAISGSASKITDVTRQEMSNTAALPPNRGPHRLAQTKRASTARMGHTRRCDVPSEARPQPCNDILLKEEVRHS
ncbi:hypothetical protein AOLI_G00040910 [Acnodon oligacanthus]